MKNFRKLTIALAGAAMLAGLAFVAQPLAQSIGVIIRAQTGLANSPTVSNVGADAGLYFGTKIMGVVGHMAGGNSTATVPTSCTNCTLVTGSDDKAGEFATTSSTATVTFGTAYTAAPSCVVSAKSSAVQPTFLTSTAGLHFTTIGNVLSYYYFCMGKAGG